MYSGLARTLNMKEEWFGHGRLGQMVFVKLVMLVSSESTDTTVYVNMEDISYT